MHLYALMHIISLCFGDSFFSRFQLIVLVKLAVGWSNCTICRASVLAGSGLTEPQCVNNKAQSIPHFCFCKGPSLLSLSFLIFSLCALLVDPSSSSTNWRGRRKRALVVPLHNFTHPFIHIWMFVCAYISIIVPAVRRGGLSSQRNPDIITHRAQNPAFRHSTIMN